MSSPSAKKSPAQIQEEEKLKEEARSLFTQGKFKKALPVYQRLSELNPKDLRIMSRVGELLHKDGQNQAACKVFHAVAAQYSQQGMFVQAIAINKIILKINPNEKGMLKELANLYSHKKDGVDEAAKILPRLKSPESDKSVKPENPLSDEVKDRVVTHAEAEEVMDLDSAAEISVPATPLLSDLDTEALERAMELMILREFQPGEKILIEGEFGDSIFILSEGQVGVSTQDTGGQDVVLATLKAGDFFGEFAYFSDRRRHATVTAQMPVVALELDRAAIEALIYEFKSVAEILKKFYRTRLLETLLAKSRIFSRLTKEQRQELARCFTAEAHAPGSVIMREGEMGDFMVLIQEGKLAVETHKDGKKVQLAELAEGHFCGEFAVLTDAKRTADVTCLVPCKLLRLSKDSAREFFRNHPELHRTLKAIADERVENTIRTLTK